MCLIFLLIQHFLIVPIILAFAYSFDSTHWLPSIYIYIYSIYIIFIDGTNSGMIILYNVTSLLALSALSIIMILTIIFLKTNQLNSKLPWANIHPSVHFNRILHKIFLVIVLNFDSEVELIT